MRTLVTTCFILLAFSLEVPAQTLRTDGAIMQVSPTATVISPGAISIQGNGGMLNAGTIYLKGDWINNGQGLLASLPGTVDFNGNQTQFIGGNNVTTFAYLRQSNPTGIFLSNNVNIGSTLIFNDGKMTTGPYEVRMINFPANAIAGATINRYINGNLRVAFDTAAIAQYKYEIGSTAYAPVQIIINAITDGGTLLAFTATGPSAQENFPVSGASGLDPFARVDRHWTLAQNGMLFQDYQATFDFNQSSFTGNVQDYVIRHNDPLTGWQSESTSNNGSTASNVLRDGVLVMGELANTDIMEQPTNTVYVFPNPSNGIFSVMGLEGRPYEMKLHDITGRIIFERTSGGERESLIDITHLKPESGSYILNIYNEHLYLNKRIIIH